MKHWKQFLFMSVLIVFGGLLVVEAYTMQQPPLQVVVTCRASAPICARLFDAFALAYGYQDTVPNPAFDPAKPEDRANPRTIPNPQTKKDFMEEKAETYIREVASTKEAEAAATAARDAKKKELEDALKRARVGNNNK